MVTKILSPTDKSLELGENVVVWSELVPNRKTLFDTELPPPPPAAGKKLEKSAILF